MDIGHGRHRTTKSTRGKCVEIDMKMEFVETIKVRIQTNLNQRRNVFMNSKILQHRGDKVNFLSMMPLRSNLLVSNAHKW